MSSGASVLGNNPAFSHSNQDKEADLNIAKTGDGYDEGICVFVMTTIIRLDFDIEYNDVHDATDNGVITALVTITSSLPVLSLFGSLALLLHCSSDGCLLVSEWFLFLQEEEKLSKANWSLL